MLLYNDSPLVIYHHRLLCGPFACRINVNLKFNSTGLKYITYTVSFFLIYRGIFDGYIGKPVRSIRKIHLHPQFDSKRLKNNIAIIELDAPIVPKILCIPTISDNLSKFQTFMPLKYSLLGPLRLIITNMNTCTKRWRGEGTQLATDGSHICANLEADLIDRIKLKHPEECKKQLEGMPLVYKAKEKYFLRGILDISLANRCDHNGLSEVFIDVMFHADWIRETYSKCSSCHGTISVSDGKDDEIMEDWRNLDPRNCTGNYGTRQAVSKFFFVVVCGYGLYRNKAYTNFFSSKS